MCSSKSLSFEFRWRLLLWYPLVLIAGWLSLLTLLNLFSWKKKSKTFVRSYGTIIEPSATKPLSFVGNSKALLEFDPLLCLEWDATEWLIEAGDVYKLFFDAPGILWDGSWFYTHLYKFGEIMQPNHLLVLSSLSEAWGEIFLQHTSCSFFIVSPQLRSQAFGHDLVSLLQQLLNSWKMTAYQIL